MANNLPPFGVRCVSTALDDPALASAWKSLLSPPLDFCAGRKESGCAAIQSGADTPHSKADDLLLPLLISGDLDVSELKIDGSGDGEADSMEYNGADDPSGA